MLEIKDLTKIFNAGTSNEKIALNHLSLTLQDGDFVSIIGSNGAGKSTLLNAIAGSFYIDEGIILLDNQNITYLPNYKRSQNIGHLYQDPLKGSAPHMTILENLALAYCRGADKFHPFHIITKKQRAFFKEMVASLKMGLEEHLDQPVGLLSGGQRQALTLLMATLNPPKLLLLDEHTAALDPATAQIVIDLTKKIVEKYNLTCLMITHNMQQALDLGNRTIMMEQGRIVLDVSGTQREQMKVQDLLDAFKQTTGQNLNNDRMLLG